MVRRDSCQQVVPKVCSKVQKTRENNSTCLKNPTGSHNETSKWFSNDFLNGSYTFLRLGS